MKRVGCRRCECVYSDVYACVLVYIVLGVLKISLANLFSLIFMKFARESFGKPLPYTKTMLVLANNTCHHKH